MPGREPTVWVVAGCLFEISLTVRKSGRWRWRSPSPQVTLLAEELRGSQQHFRFRAEEAGAVTGVILLRFRSDNGVTENSVAVKIAPERLTST